MFIKKKKNHLLPRVGYKNDCFQGQEWTFHPCEDISLFNRVHFYINNPNQATPKRSPQGWS